VHIGIKTVAPIRSGLRLVRADQLWSDEDRRDVQSRLGELAAKHGVEGAAVSFEPDRLEVEVPHRQQVGQVVALQNWLDTERETLEVSQVPDVERP
jgi:hypothetical protein